MGYSLFGMAERDGAKKARREVISNVRKSLEQDNVPEDVIERAVRSILDCE